MGHLPRELLLKEKRKRLLKLVNNILLRISPPLLHVLLQNLLTCWIYGLNTFLYSIQYMQMYSLHFTLISTVFVEAKKLSLPTIILNYQLHNGNSLKSSKKRYYMVESFLVA